MINVMTGEPISREMNDVLSRLDRYENVPLEEIMNLKEIKEANDCVVGYEQTYNKKGRESIRDGVFKRLQQMGSVVFDTQGKAVHIGDVEKGRRLDIVIGLSGSGKSSAIVEPLSSLYHSRIIDSDFAKKLLPEYNGGWGTNIVHKESQLIAERQTVITLKNNENMIHARATADINALKKTILQAKSNGYYVYVHYLELHSNKAMGRMLRRFLETGRYIPPDVVAYGSDKISQSFELLKNEINLLDGYSHWDNDVPYKASPRIIEYSASCRDFCEYMNRSSLEKTNLKIIHDKINEVNAIMRENPQLLREFKKAQSDYRKKKIKKKNTIKQG